MLTHEDEVNTFRDFLEELEGALIGEKEVMVVLG